MAIVLKTIVGESRPWVRIPPLPIWPSGEMVNAGDLKSLTERFPGSSPGRAIKQH